MSMELFHALNRGVDGRNIFTDHADYVRFVHDLYEFNDAAPAPQFNRRPDVGHPMSNIKARTKIVDLHGWCLMKNHYHLLLSERREGGLLLFLRKLNVGYARAFNQKHRRNGFLFQGGTKKVPIKTDAHFNYILHYIHLNPLDYLAGAEKWRVRDKGDIPDMRTALAHLEHYRWSSYLDYAGTKNFPSILTTSLFQERPGSYAKELREYLEAAEEDALADLRLE